MNEEKELWNEVEKLQQVLNETVSKKGVNSPEAKRAIEAFRIKMQEYNGLIKR